MVEEARQEPQDLVAWDHHDVLRFTLLWSSVQYKEAVYVIARESLLCTYRDPSSDRRTEPTSGFQLHAMTLDGTHYVKLLFRDARESKLRLVRQNVFRAYQKAILDKKLPPDNDFSFQMDNNMQGLSQQHITGKEMPFAVVLEGDLDSLQLAIL